MKKTATLALITLVLIGMFTGCSTSTSSNGFDSARPINIVSREDGSGTRSAFIELFGIEEKDENGGKKDRTTKDSIIATKTDIMLTNIETDKYAIGYVSMGSLSDKIKPLQIDGAAPSSENVKNGSYTISRPFIIAVKDQPQGLVKDFIDFILSSEGQQVVSNGYIPIVNDADAFSGNLPSGKIVVAGSSSVTPIMEKLKEAYVSLNPSAAIEIQMSDSTSGMNGVMEGTCDIGMASRDLKESETAILNGIEIALDGIAVVVNKENSLINLTKNQVKDIYTGKTEYWSEIS